MSAGAGPLVERLIAKDVPAAPVNTVADALADPHVRHRGMVLELADETDGRRARVAGVPLKFDGDANGLPAYPPHLGQNGRAVLKDVLGLDQAEAAALVEAGVIVERRGSPAAGG